MNKENEFSNLKISQNNIVKKKSSLSLSLSLSLSAKRPQRKLITFSLFVLIFAFFICCTPTSIQTAGCGGDTNQDNPNEKIERIEIIHLPNKTLYYSGERLILQGLEVFAFYTNGNRERIYDYSSSVNNDQVLDSTISFIIISYKDFSEQFPITIIPNTIDGILISFPVFADPQNLLQYNEQTGIFTAKSGYKQYNWWIDEEKISNSSQTFKISNYSKSSGNHSLMLEVADSLGEHYSANAYFTVYENDVSFISVNIQAMNNDPNLLKFENQQFIVADGYSSITWYLDAKKLSYTGKTLGFQNMGNPKGNHTLILIVKNSNGQYYSAQSQFIVNENVVNTESGNLSPAATMIDVSINHYSDIKGLLEYDSQIKQFKALKGFNKYIWWVDGVKTDNSSTIFVLDESSYKPGIHCVMLVVEDDYGNNYSAQYQMMVSNVVANNTSSCSVIIVNIPQYGSKENFLYYDSHTGYFLTKNTYSTYDWWIDDELVAQGVSGLKISALNLNKGFRNLILIVSDSLGNTFASTAELLIE